MQIERKKLALIFKAFSDENRIEILEILRNGEHCACELLAQLKITQSTLSHHMKILVDCDIVISKKVGKWIHYQINKESYAIAIASLQYLQEIKERIPTCDKKL